MCLNFVIDFANGTHVSSISLLVVLKGDLVSHFEVRADLDVDFTPWLDYAILFLFEPSERFFLKILKIRVMID